MLVLYWRFSGALNAEIWLKICTKPEFLPIERSQFAGRLPIDRSFPFNVSQRVFT